MATKVKPVLHADFEAEDSLLAVCLQSPQALEAVCKVVAAGELRPKDFYRLSRGKVLDVMCELHAAGVELDPLTLSLALERHVDLLEKLGGRSFTHYLSDLVVVAGNVRTFITRIRELAAQRQFATVSAEICELAKANDQSVEARVAAASAALAAVPARPVSRRAEVTDDLLVSFNDIEAKPVEWVWSSWIPAGMPSILFGLSGLGKSHIYADIAARISRGATFPDGAQAPYGNVIIMSAEDSAESVLKPRLVYAKADCARIFHFPSVARFDGKGKRVFSLIDDLDILDRHIALREGVLAVIDPITAYLSGVDSHIVTEVRAALALIDEVAQNTGAAILCIMHPNKSMTGDMKAVQRLSGSGAFGDAPRCVLLVAEDRDRKEEKRRLLLPAKMNLGLWPEGIGYTITADGPLTCASGVCWDQDAVTVNADEAMAPARRPSPTIQAAMDFLAAALADGDWHAARDLIDEADGRHINQKTLERAAKQLKVARRKSGFPAVSEWCSEVGS